MNVFDRYYRSLAEAKELKEAQRCFQSKRKEKVKAKRKPFVPRPKKERQVDTRSFKEVLAGIGRY